MVHCERCGGNWEPKVKEPVRCRWCGSQYWRLPRKDGVKPKVGEVEVELSGDGEVLGAVVEDVAKPEKVAAVVKPENAREKRKREERERNERMADVRADVPLHPFEDQ